MGGTLQWYPSLRLPPQSLRFLDERSLETKDNTHNAVGERRQGLSERRDGLGVFRGSLQAPSLAFEVGDFLLQLLACSVSSRNQVFDLIWR